MNLSLLGEDMRGRGVSATPFGESERDSLRSACAEDEEIWPIYSTDFGPNGFDSAIDRILSRNDWRLFILRAQGGELIGMSPARCWKSARHITGRNFAAPASTGRLRL